MGTALSAGLNGASGAGRFLYPARMLGFVLMLAGLRGSGSAIKALNGALMPLKAV